MARESAIKAIHETMFGLQGKLIFLQEQYSVYHDNYSAEAMELLGVAEAYNKAVELDPNSAANNFSMGRIYYNQGVSTLDKANSISDATQYKQEKAKAEELFRKALPFFEKARELKPDEKEFLIGLRGIYYNLNMNEKFDEIEAEMNK